MELLHGESHIQIQISRGGAVQTGPKTEKMWILGVYGFTYTNSCEECWEGSDSKGNITMYKLAHFVAHTRVTTWRELHSFDVMCLQKFL